MGNQGKQGSRLRLCRNRLNLSCWAPATLRVTLLALIKATKKYGLVPSGFIPYQCRPAFVAGVFHIEEEGVQLVEVNTRGKIKNYYYPAEEFGQEFDPLDKKYLASEK